MPAQPVYTNRTKRTIRTLDTRRKGCYSTLATLRNTKGASPVDYLTPRQIAERLDVAPWTVRRWITLGWLDSFRVGGRLRVREEDYYRFKREGIPQAGPPKAERVAS